MSSPPPQGHVEPDNAPVDDKAVARARRIAAAVVRSRSEYKSEHAYTERGWFLANDQVGTSKVDRQHVEYASTWRLLHSEPPHQEEEAARALADILALPGSFVSMPREMATTAIRAAVLAGQVDTAARLARETKIHWRQNLGTAMAAAEGLMAAGEVRESTHPLIHIMAYALHYPVLVTLSERLHALIPQTQGEEMGEGEGEGGEDGRRETPLQTLAAAVDGLVASRAWGFPPLFGQSQHETPRPVAGGAELKTRLVAVDVPVLARALGMADEATKKGGRKGNAPDDIRMLEMALRRMQGAMGRQQDEVEVKPGERVERGVREL